MSTTNGERPAGELATADLAPLPAPAAARKPPPDVDRLTSNDHRRLRQALGRDPREVFGSDDYEDVLQGLVLAHKLREDPSFTWEQAGDVVPGDVFDMSAGEPPPPQGGTPGSPGQEPATTKPAASKTRRRAAGSAPS